MCFSGFYCKAPRLPLACCEALHNYKCWSTESCLLILLSTFRHNRGWLKCCPVWMHTNIWNEHLEKENKQRRCRGKWKEEFEVNVNEFWQIDDEGGAKLTASGVNPSPDPSHLLTPLCVCGSRRRTSSLDSDVSLTDGGRNIKSKTVWALLRENHLTPHGTIAPASRLPHRSPLQAFPAVPSLRGEDKMSWKTAEAHLRIPAWSSAWLPGLTSRQSSLSVFQVRPVSLPHSLPSGPWTLVGHMRLKEWAAGFQNEVASWEEGNHSPGTLCNNLLGHLC